MSESPATRIAQLRKEIARHDELYYRQTAPEISDFDYDQLKKKLAALESAHPDLAGPSPTEKVGDDRSEGFVTRRHRMPMLSLDNTYNVDELRDFDSRLRRVLADQELPLAKHPLEYVVEPKVDGLAICLTYEKGKFVRAVTRGNGVEGDDISANLRTVRGLPLELKGHDHPAVMEIRGEIFLTIEEFRRINAEREEAGKPLYANPRNLAAGTAKLLDPAEAARRHLRVILYGLGFCDPLPCQTQFELHHHLRQWGLPSHPRENVWRAKGADEVWSCIQKLDKLRHDFDYATDGAVVKLDDFAGQIAAESTAKAPRWAMAYKFAPEQAETKLRSVIIQVGRTGILAPVADLEPVFLAGSTISRATLHNADEIARKDIREGDTVVIEKAGEVIPAVVRVVMEKRPAHSRPWHFPEKCPACGTKAVRHEGEVAWRCPNPACPPQVARRLQFFCTRKALDIEDVGEIVADSLTKNGRIKDPLDLFTLTVEDLGRLNLGDEENPRVFGEKNATRVIEALLRAKELPLSRWLYALGLPNVGDVTAKELTYNHKDFTELARSKILPKIVLDTNLKEKRLKLFRTGKQMGEEIERTNEKLHGVNEGSEVALRERLKRNLKSLIEEKAKGLEEYDRIGNEREDLDKLLFPFRILQKVEASTAEVVRQNFRSLERLERKDKSLRNEIKKLNRLKESLGRLRRQSKIEPELRAAIVDLVGQIDSVKAQGPIQKLKRLQDEKTEFRSSWDEQFRRDEEAKIEEEVISIAIEFIDSRYCNEFELKIQDQLDQLKAPIDNLKKLLRPYPILDSIGPETAKSVIEFFDSKEGQLFLTRLNELRINPNSDNLRTAAKLGPLAGQTFVITGTLPTLKRQEATKLIEEAGGHVGSAVSKNTNYLVAGEEAGSKLDNARKLGVPILDEPALRKMLNF